METFTNKNNKYIFAEDFIEAYNACVDKLTILTISHKMDIKGLSRSLGTSLTIKKDGGNVKVAIKVDALQKYVKRLMKHGARNKGGYYAARAAVFCRVMFESGLIKSTGFTNDGEVNRFNDVPGYNTVSLVPELKKEAVADDIRSDEKVELDTSDMKPKKERRVQLKKVHKTSQEKIDEAIERIKQRNERTRKLNAKDMTIIKKESDKLTQCAEYVQKAAEIFAA